MAAQIEEIFVAADRLEREKFLPLRLQMPFELCAGLADRRQLARYQVQRRVAADCVKASGIA